MTYKSINKSIRNISVSFLTASSFVAPEIYVGIGFALHNSSNRVGLGGDRNIRMDPVYSNMQFIAYNASFLT